MGKLRILSGRDIRTILEAHGFVCVRQRGSHMVLQKRTGDGTTTVPVPDHREVKIAVVQAIIRQSGIPRSAFEV